MKIQLLIWKINILGINKSKSGLPHCIWVLAVLQDLHQLSAVSCGLLLFVCFRKWQRQNCTRFIKVCTCRRIYTLLKAWNTVRSSLSVQMTFSSSLIPNLVSLQRVLGYLFIIASTNYNNHSVKASLSRYNPLWTFIMPCVCCVVRLTCNNSPSNHFLTSILVETLLCTFFLSGSHHK